MQKKHAPVHAPVQNYDNDDDDDDTWRPGIHCWRAIAILAAACTPEKQGHDVGAISMPFIFYPDL